MCENVMNNQQETSCFETENIFIKNAHFEITTKLFDVLFNPRFLFSNNL